MTCDRNRNWKIIKMGQGTQFECHRIIESTKVLKGFFYNSWPRQSNRDNWIYHIKNNSCWLCFSFFKTSTHPYYHLPKIIRSFSHFWCWTYNNICAKVPTTATGKPPKKKEKNFTTSVNYLQKLRTPPPSPYFTTI